MLRNLIHGADTVMSHILHFYHLTALDFLDASFLGSPWNPPAGPVSMLADVRTTNNLTGRTFLSSYLTALDIRREAHTMGAILSGRQPIQNAMVPGGATTLFTQTDIDMFGTKLNRIRNFINDTYIPDVVKAATLWPAYLFTGTGTQDALAYGDYVTDTNGTLFFKRGRATLSPLSLNTFDASTDITEHLLYSRYNDADTQLHPSVGKTRTDIHKAGAYSWLKAPRLSDNVCEVGPMPRMLMNHLSGGGPSVNEDNSTAMNIGSGTWTLPASYNASDIVTGALGALNALISAGSVGPAQLFSPLGRHAARALECKYVADAMGGTGGWLEQLTLNNTTTGSGYTHNKIPRDIQNGMGLCEAPRGALGHWMSTEFKRITNYQCVVPSTWNHSPRDDNNNAGPAESAVEMTNLGSGTDTQILNAIRVLHAYDFCIACAVHIVRPDGTEVAKVLMDTDGKVKKLPIE
jgi:hydrogenase large subunit